MRLPPIQEVIHRLVAGSGVRLLRFLVGALVLLALTTWYDLSQARNLSAPDAMETAQLARNLARGEGFTTQVVRPLTLQWVENTQGVNGRLGRQPHPDLFSPPLYPLLLAGWMKLLPFDYEVGARFWRYQPELLIALLNQLLFVATVWLGSLLAGRLISTEAGVLFAALLFASELLWRFSVSGLSTMLLLLLGVGLLWALVRIEEAARTNAHRGGWYLRWGALAGLLLGMMGLTRYSALVLILPATLFFLLCLDRRGLVVTVSAWVVCAAVVAPWLMRNHQVSGTWLGVPGQALYEETVRFPGTRLQRSFTPDVAAVEKPEIFSKGMEGLRHTLGDDFLKPGGGWFGAFFLVGLIGQYRNPAVSRLRVFLLLSLATLTVAQSLARTHLSTASPTVNSENLLVLLTPGVFLVGVAFYAWLLEQFELPYPDFRHVISTGLVLGTAAPLLLGFLPPRSIPIVYPPYFPPLLQRASGFLKTSEILMTDLPWATAWYGDRTSVWTTLDAGPSFYQVHDQSPGLTALLLTPLTTDTQFRRDVLTVRDYTWSHLVVDVLLRTNVPTGFPLRYAWSEGLPDNLFLANYLLAEREAWFQRPPPVAAPATEGEKTPGTE